MAAQPKIRVLMACCTAAWLSVDASRACGQSFQLLGLPPGMTQAFAEGVSYDGRVVAGRAANSFGQGPGWYWTQGSGRVDISGPGLGGESRGYGVSGDGVYIVGTTGPGSSQAPSTAYRYNRLTGEVISLGVEAGGDRSFALAASETGSVVVGYSALDQTLSQTLAFRWTEAGGLQSLGFARPGDFQSRALAVSADGETVIGDSGDGTLVAFRWTSTTGMTILAGTPGTNANRASGMSSSGELIVGLSGNHAALWTNGVYSDLGTAPGYVRCIATGISDNGLVAIGQVTNGPPSTDTAAIWLAGTGWQPLEPYLQSIGITVPVGIDLRDATAISRDGRTIVGNARGTMLQGFVVAIPAPASLFVFALVPVTSRRRRGAMHT